MHMWPGGGGVRENQYPGKFSCVQKYNWHVLYAQYNIGHCVNKHATSMTTHFFNVINVTSQQESVSYCQWATANGETRRMYPVSEHVAKNKKSFLVREGQEECASQ